MQCTIVECILGQKKDTCGKTGQIWSLEFSWKYCINVMSYSWKMYHCSKMLTSQRVEQRVRRSSLYHLCTSPFNLKVSQRKGFFKGLITHITHHTNTRWKRSQAAKVDGKSWSPVARDDSSLGRVPGEIQSQLFGGHQRASEARAQGHNSNRQGRG